MILHLIRALFVLLMAAIGAWYLKEEPGPFGDEWNWATLGAALVAAVLVLSIDILSSRRKLFAFSGVLFGLLAGLLIAYALGYVVEWLVNQFMPAGDVEANKIRAQLIDFLKMALNIICAYLGISFVMQTKDDFRFIIPYVEFAKQTRGVRPLLLDSSVLIDGRIVDLGEVGVMESRVIVPQFVVDELQKLADSADRLKRTRGRRGLDNIARLQSMRKLDMAIYEGAPHTTRAEGVDQKLLAMAVEMNGRVLTTDFNLNKVGQLQGIDIINLNDIASAMKPVVLPGDQIALQLVKPGEQPGQAVGYLDDGTMVVVEQARQHIGQPEVLVTATSVVQTSAGRMVFARIGAEPRARRGRQPVSHQPESEA